MLCLSLSRSSPDSLESLSSNIQKREGPDIKKIFDQSKVPVEKLINGEFGDEKVSAKGTRSILRAVKFVSFGSFCRGYGGGNGKRSFTASPISA